MTTDDHARQLLTRGFTILPEALSCGEVEQANRLLKGIWEREKEAGVRHKWHNDSWVISYCLPAKHAFFRELALNPRVLPLIRAVLGEEVIISSLNGMMMVPRGVGQKLHLDQPQQVPGLVININGTYALDDFTRANGATRVVPYSQDRRPGTPIDHEADEREAIYLEAPAGSMLVFNGGIVHAGSANTTGAPRRCVHTFYSRPWVRSQWDFLRSIPEDARGAMSEEMKRMFGFYAHEQVFDVTKQTVRRE